MKAILVGVALAVVALFFACTGGTASDSTLKACYAGGYLQGSGVRQSYEAVEKSLGLAPTSSEAQLCLSFYKDGKADAEQGHSPRY